MQPGLMGRKRPVITNVGCRAKDRLVWCLPMENFGSFKRLFEKDGHYSSFLLNSEPDSPETTRPFFLLKDAIAESADVESELKRLLADGDWRPRIVACAALGFTKPTKSLIAAYWSAFDKLENGAYGWEPLPAVLSLYDKDFSQHIMKRLVPQFIKPQSQIQLPTIEQTSDKSKIQFIVSIPLPYKNEEAVSGNSKLPNGHIAALLGLLADPKDRETQDLLKTQNDYVAALEWRSRYLPIVKKMK